MVSEGVTSHSPDGPLPRGEGKKRQGCHWATLVRLKPHIGKPPNIPLFSFFFSFWHMEFLGQGSDPSRGCDLRCSCSNARSFNPLCWGGGSNRYPSAAETLLVPLCPSGNCDSLVTLTLLSQRILSSLAHSFGHPPFTEPWPLGAWCWERTCESHAVEEVFILLGYPAEGDISRNRLLFHLVEELEGQCQSDVGVQERSLAWSRVFTDASLRKQGLA